MRLNMTNEQSAEVQESLLTFLASVGDACLHEESLSGKFQVGLVFVDDVGIQEINLRERSIDAPTDVLSFPNVQYPKDRTANACSKRLRREMDFETGCIDLGDIVLSLSKAREQAEAYGHSFVREVGYLFTHGILHLMGYDHDTVDRQMKMRKIEESIMEKTGLPRELLDDDMPLIEGARQAMKAAYAPYSKYKVGACLRATDGRLFRGCNVENASFGMTICAERNAITTAVTEGAREFTAIAIAVEGAMPSPCGACRQMMREFAMEIRVLLVNQEGIKITSLSELLPNSFGPEFLNEVNA